MGAIFLNRDARRGSKSVAGPVTGIVYTITQFGTPVHELDAPGLLAMLEDPCCGHILPFGGQVRSFGIHAATADQLASVPEFVWEAGPFEVPIVEQPQKKMKIYEREKVIPQTIEDESEEVI